jgi:hypothetical protein
MFLKNEELFIDSDRFDIRVKSFFIKKFKFQLLTVMNMTKGDRDEMLALHLTLILVLVIN